MEIAVRAFRKSDLSAMRMVWNGVVQAGVAFPQTECLDEAAGLAFFSSQSYTGVAVDAESGALLGLYILHPNNIGRCGHIANASYAVMENRRGLHVGERLVVDCMEQAKRMGFRILEFNAVVATNEPALKLYEKLGFVRLGVIPGGFLLKDGTYADIIPHYRTL